MSYYVPTLPCLDCLTIVMTIAATTSVPVFIPSTKLKIQLPSSFYLSQQDFVTWCTRFREQAALEREMSGTSPEVPLSEESFQFCLGYKYGKRLGRKSLHAIYLSRSLTTRLFENASKTFVKDLQGIVAVAENIEAERDFQEKVYQFLVKAQAVYFLISL
ncbi:hypothetical protein METBISCDRAFT_24222 [Metschnikowia bicuspidata]|uniref:Uncharacterized protein n=1 Tax=Metschnikowia bicuspidata TaxID=27322 RepID=A0A4P9Z9I4_9ASCO|nr:hypothetical protein METBISCDRAFT_24222 [Metschnikowia bicuspidata]